MDTKERFGELSLWDVSQENFEKKIDILAYKYFLLREKDLEESIKRYEYHKKEVGGNKSEDTDNFDK